MKHNQTSKALPPLEDGFFLSINKSYLGFLEDRRKLCPRTRILVTINNKMKMWWPYPNFCHWKSKGTEQSMYMVTSKYNFLLSIWKGWWTFYTPKWLMNCLSNSKGNKLSCQHLMMVWSGRCFIFYFLKVSGKVFYKAPSYNHKPNESIKQREMRLFPGYYQRENSKNLVISEQN